MSLKANNIFLLTIELLFVGYVLLDVYGTIFVGFDDHIEHSEEDRVVSLNSTNDDPMVVKMGNFAVDEYNKLSGSNLKFRGVIKALYAKSSHMMLIDTQGVSDSKRRLYTAIVVEQGTQMGLVAFQEYAESAL